MVGRCRRKRIISKQTRREIEKKKWVGRGVKTSCLQKVKPKRTQAGSGGGVGKKRRKHEAICGGNRISEIRGEEENKEDKNKQTNEQQVM
mmetsp:Transcript_40606/g.46634  ORF Transcript_40606/g.46634 Transcript_40606/m.46634 type:complete len:90 (-) Transcript_40606:740-1009(-)